MGKYNFDEIIERHDTYSYKWDLMPSYDVLPLWVADMDFKAAPAIFKEVNRLAQNGVYGYGCIPKSFYNAIVDFHKRHYGQEVHQDWIIPTPAVVPALTAVLQALTQPGDEVIVQTPAYNCFFSCLNNSGVVTVENPICYKDGEFKLDFEDLEAKAKSPKAKVLLFCNPQNPTGRLWSKEELLKVLKICKKHNLIVISDEVHCDIKPNTAVFTAFSTLDKSFNDKVITLRSPSKTFNIAGLKAAYIICQNEEYRYKIDRQVNINEICDLSPFGVAATVAAYTECDDWMYELNDYIQDNYRYLVEFFKTNFKDFKVAKLESTYLAWVDCSALNLTSKEITYKLLTSGKVYLNDGKMYHAPKEGFVRINLGCPRALLKEALLRFKECFSKKA